MNKFSERKIILASGSPRRRELLSALAPQFETAPSREVDEVYPADMAASEVAPFLSSVKAEAYDDLAFDGSIVITADTVVILDGEILGKPCDEDDAVAMLRKLSGRTHTVVTGVTIMTAMKTVTFSDTTEVEFDHLTDEEITRYVECFRPLDKAGAYGIQEWIGYIGIKGIRGCYYNVMGLPLHALYRHLLTLA